ncbi:rod-determining factor RdfA [Salinigranum marinum]|uniref:rod-determining factor RdfA n=1 Tax=Salinigranum marinum TaxID=1515595 RepID=UPI002989DAA8|nr:rod-determining factor RdfA [Salinigranum marinum]
MPKSGGCKVDRVSDKYALLDLDDRILTRRTEDGAGGRRLASYINHWLLRRAMFSEGMSVIDGAERNYYRLLTDDDVAETSRNDARRRLRLAGVDVEEVEDDFVSHKAVYHHLNKCLGVDTSRNYTPDLSKGLVDIEKFIGRIKIVVSGEISRLSKYGRVAISEPDVIVSVKIRCSDCGRSHNIVHFMRNPKCHCIGSSSDLTESE